MILIEPTVSRNQHVAFLSALILAVKSAYPDELLVFWGNLEKNKEIKAYISRNGDDQLVGIHLENMYGSGSPASASWLNRQLSLIFICIKCFCCNNKTHSGVIFCSTHWPMVLYMQWIKLIPWFRKKSAVIVHDTLDLLTSNKTVSSLVKLIRLNNDVVVLSKDIAEYVAVKLNNKINLKSINLPCIWKKTNNNIELKSPIKFGFIGESKKGLALFHDIAREVVFKRPGVEFWMIGKSSAYEVELYGDVVKGLSETWLSEDDYNGRLATMNFIIFPYKGERYDYRASATFIDGLSFIVPGVYIENRYIAECVRKLGEIGMVCRDKECVKETIVDIIDNLSIEKCVSYKENIVKSRDIFGVKAVGEQVRSIFEER